MSERTGQQPNGAPEQPESPEHRFPIVVLAAPGVVALLFVAMADKAADVLQSGSRALLIAGICSIVSILCFGVMAGLAKEQPVRIFGVAGIAATVLLIGRAVMYMI